MKRGFCRSGHSEWQETDTRASGKTARSK